MATFVSLALISEMGSTDFVRWVAFKATVARLE